MTDFRSAGEKIHMKRLFLSIFMLIALALPAFAELDGMVVNVADSGEITVNKGIADSVTPGTKWYIYRSGKPKAEIEAVLVDNYTTQARIVSGSGVSVGDKATTKAFTSPIAGTAEAKAQARPTIEDKIPKNQVDPRFRNTPKPKEETAESTAKAYDKLVASCTKTASFSGGTGKHRKTSIDPMLTYNMFSKLNSSSVLTLQNVIPTVYGEVAYNKTMRDQQKQCCVDIAVTWWSENLLDAYSDMIAFREGRTSTDQRLALRNGLYSQKGVDKFIVFHIKMKNTGRANVQIEPFHWHAYLLDDQGNRVKAERYDQILDRTLTPGQETEGNIYFLKYDASGRNFSGSHATLVLEDILAERATMKF